MRTLILVVALGLATACAPQIPDSGAGLDPTADQVAEREAARTGATAPAPKAISQEVLAPAIPNRPAVPVARATPQTALAPVTRLSASQPDRAGDIAQETAAASQDQGVLPLQASPSNPAPQVPGDSEISDENDFSAVSARESIESDAARIAKNRQRYQSVAPTALPERPTEIGPNIVHYALSTQNDPGVQVYSRIGLNLSTRAQRNCARYPSPDQAQIDFLTRGGPRRDRLGLDPDGDGFACSWDPRPFRLAARSQ